MTPNEGSTFRCELHVHSTYSDGSASPDDLLRHAVKIGLSVVAPDLPLMGTEPVTHAMVEAVRARATRYAPEM